MCACIQCKTTDAYGLRGFATWPKGEQATPAEAKKLYAQHTAFNWKDARKRADLGGAGASFYGTPAGLTRAEVEATLSATFQQATTSPDLPRFVPAAASAPNRWTIQDRQEGGYHPGVPDPGFTRAVAELHAERLNAKATPSAS